MEDKDAIVARGRILWNSIYDPYADKLHDKLSSYHPDFMGEYTRTHNHRIFHPSSLFHSLSLVCSRSLRPTATLYSTPAPDCALGLHSRIDGTEENLAWLCSNLTLSSAIHPRSTADPRGTFGEGSFFLLPDPIPLRHSPLWAHS